MIYKRYNRAGRTRWVVKVYIGQGADRRKLDKHVGTFDTKREAKAAEATAIEQFATKSGNETIRRVRSPLARRLPPRAQQHPPLPRAGDQEVHRRARRPSAADHHPPRGA